MERTLKTFQCTHILGASRSAVFFAIAQLSCRDMVTYWLKWPIFATFLLPLSHSAPSFPMFPSEFRAEVNRQENSHGAILQWRPHDRRWNGFGMIPDCDRRSDGRTESIIAKAALCIASYTDALSKMTSALHITTAHLSGFLPALVRMTLNDLECPIHLKVRFTDVRHAWRTYMLWLSELAMRN